MNNPLKVLEARVRAKNRCNLAANETFRILTDIFRPLVGCKVLKQSGEFLATVEKLLPDFPYSNDLHVYRYCIKYSLVWVAKSCEQVVNGSSCLYEESSTYVANLDGQVCGSLVDNHEDYRTDYSVDEIQELRLVCKAKKKEYDAAEEAVYPFGE